MFEAQLLIAKAASAVEVYSPWFQRAGDNAVFTLDVVDLDGNPNVVVRAFTKRSEESGPGTDANSSISISRNSIGRASDTWVSTTLIGFEELVRFKFTLTADNNGDWMLFRMLAPVWFDDVDV